MKPVLIHLNSYPGVGKLTIGRLVEDQIGGKLLDNHSIYNVALALTPFKSDEYYQAIRDVRQVAYDLVEGLPRERPVILTNAHSQDSDWGNASWDAAIDLAQRTERAHCVVLLTCSRAENARRIQSAERDARRKPRDPNLFRQGETDRPLIERGADRLLRLEVTDLSAEAAASTILRWLQS